MGILERLKQAVWSRLRLDGQRLELRRVIWISFTAAAVGISLFMGLSFYGRFMQQTRETLREENRSLLEQAGYQFHAYIRNMMKVSDSLYYSVIKRRDVDEEFILDSFQLLYDTNREEVQRIALFSEDGQLLAAAPAGKLREGVDVHREEWYRRTLAREENITFGHLEIERLFETPPEEYTRVLPMTRVVKISRGEEEEKGILLIQLKQSGLQDVFSDLLLGEGSYLYLTDADGNLLCHPKQELVESGLLEEWNPSGEYDSRPQGGDKKAEYFVNTVGYTGWKIVGVIQSGMVMLNAFQSSMMILFLLLFFVSVMVLINSFLSRKVSAPMRRLEEAVNQIEAGDLDTQIQPSGFYEVWHLGKAISQMQENLKRLMADIVEEHEAKRRSELMALQNQINPHFLYNTLDTIRIKAELNGDKEVSAMIMQMVNFFRLGVNADSEMVSVYHEIRLIESYLNLMRYRYPALNCEYEIDENLLSVEMPNFILQPLVENSVMHGMRQVGYRGTIRLSVSRDGSNPENIVIKVYDNGAGMSPEARKHLEDVLKNAGGDLREENENKHIGIVNVQKRLKIYYPDTAGLSYHDNPEGGVTVILIIKNNIEREE